MPDTNYIYVLGMDGKPQMPTKRQRHVEKLLSTGKARIACHVPFTIQLLYTNEPVLQPLMAGIDPGRTNIGVVVINEQADLIFSAVVETRNKEIRKLMDKRRAYRRASRMGERKARQRLAKHYGTMMKDGMVMRKLPQYAADSFVTCKVIKNTQARYCNRKRNDGWLTPTVNHLVQTHGNVLRKIQKFLPVTDVTMEVNRFAFLTLDNPKTSGIDFQNGPLKGFDDVNAAVYENQRGKCLMCQKGIEHYHHIIPKSEGGSNTIANIAGLCTDCHGMAHTDSSFKEAIAEKKSGLMKKYGALSAINQAIPYIWKEFVSQFEADHVSACTGKDTARVRVSLGYEKTKENQMHEADAYSIACLGLDVIPEKVPEFTCLHNIKQFRRHDRARIKSQTERTYYLDGKVVAKNRNPRFEQKGPALSDWYEEMVNSHGQKEADRLRSHLTVKKSTRRYNTKDRIMPGAVFLYNKTLYVMRAQQCNGTRYFGMDMTKSVNSKDCKIVKQNTGLVFVS